MNMSKLLLILALAIPVSLCLMSKSVSTDNETSLPMDEMLPSMDHHDIPLLELDTVLKACNKTFMIDTSFMEDLLQSGSFADESVKTPKCYVRCLLDTTGVIDPEEGEYDPELAVLLFHTRMNDTQNDAVKEMAKACTENRVETCLCERAYQFVKCLRQMEIQEYGSET